MDSNTSKATDQACHRMRLLTLLTTTATAAFAIGMAATAAAALYVLSALIAAGWDQDAPCLWQPTHNQACRRMNCLTMMMAKTEIDAAVAIAAFSASSADLDQAVP